jgi:hypothetical protein
MAAHARGALRLCSVAALLAAASALQRVALKKVAYNAAARLAPPDAPAVTDLLELAAKLHPVQLTNFMDAQARAPRESLRDSDSARCASPASASSLATHAPPRAERGRRRVSRLAAPPRRRSGPLHAPRFSVGTP